MHTTAAIGQIKFIPLLTNLCYGIQGSFRYKDICTKLHSLIYNQVNFHDSIMLNSVRFADFALACSPDTLLYWPNKLILMADCIMGKILKKVEMENLLPQH